MTPSQFTVTYEEIGGWRDNLGTFEAASVADVLDIIEERILPNGHRHNVGGDVWEWNGEQYVASSDAAEADGFGYIDFIPLTVDPDLGEAEDATYPWLVRRVTQP